MDFKVLLLLTISCVWVTAQFPNLYRLPRTAIPSHYSIHLTLGSTFYETKKFEGTVEILVEVTQPTTTITLNSADISYPEYSVTATAVTAEEPQSAPVNLTVTDNAEFEQIVLTAESQLAAGLYTLRFENYEATLHEDMSGFYLSYYTNENNELEYMATTQFQATYARRAFPCFDEPAFKAIFSVTITRPSDYISLGNTNVTTEGNTDHFTDTPVMSSYLLAFIVSKFKGYASEQNNGARQLYDVWCREEALPTAKYAYEVGPKLLDALNSFTQINYYYDMEGVDKMDQVAIPDFAAGAMENWGLVTYRETALLWDEQESTSLNQQRVASVIAHEFTHMWFGNLVTMFWWDYTWLNEGFARYYQYFITAQVENQWELEKQFVIEQQQAIFTADALGSSSALNSAASTPSEISNKFASTSYNKGASVIRMMANFMGQNNYEDGIRQYLGNHSYGNTVPADLYEDLSDFIEEGKLPVSLSDIMTTWTAQPGYPVVSVSRNGSGLILKQERFLLSATTSTLKWYVPITYTTQGNRNFEDTTVTAWLLPSEDLFIPNEESEGWVVVNVQETGYYRVNYDDELWDALTEALSANDFNTVFPDLNRAQIVDDVLNLARADKLDYSRALLVTNFLRNDDSYYPWYAAFQAFTFLRRRIESTSYVGETLQKHILELMTNLRETVSFTLSNNIQHIDVLRTSLALQWACELEEESCVEEANNLFRDYKEEGNRINPNIRSTVYCSALRQEEGSDNWNFLWDQFKATKLATEQVTIFTALGCSKDEAVLKEYLRRSIDSTSGIRKQDANSVFSAVLSGNPANVDIAFEFLSDNVEDVVNYYEGMNALSSVITGIADRLTTQEQIDRFDQFIKDNAGILKDAAITGTAAVETARANLQWAASNHDELHDWLYETYGSAASIAVSLTVLLSALAVAILNS